jgi:hypothetical protein
MAEIIGLDIVMGMDVQDVQVNLQKAQNELRQFQSQLKKSTDTSEIARLNKEIADLNKSIGNLEQGMKGVAKPAGDATQSLVNLSRIAQDAPYGFMGIANNINPMLESFQRLQKETGSTGNAIKSMVASIAGPAGLGLAVGVATSLLTVYSKEIANFFKGPAEKLKEFREELKKLNEDVYKIVGGAQANRTVGLSYVNMITGGNATQQQEALKALKSLYSNNKEIQDLKVTSDKAYLIHLVNMASKQEEYAGKEKNNVEALKAAYAERKKLEDEMASKQAALKAPTSYDIGMGQRMTLTPAQQEDALKGMKQKVADGYSSALAEIDNRIKSYTSREGTFIDQVTGFATKDKKGGKIVDTDKVLESNEAKKNRLELAEIKARVARGKEIGLGMVDTFDEADDKGKAERKRLADIKQFGESKLGKIAGEGMKGKGSPLVDEAQKENDLLTANIALAKERQTQYEKFAETISSTLTNSVMGLWDAFEKGQDIGQALGDMFMDLAKQIAAAAIKAAIFSTIMSIVMPGAGAAGAAGGGGFMSMFKGLLGLAEGGIVNKPTLAMVGEGNQSEAVMPLSKLGSMMQNTFDAGAMSGTGGGGGGQFTLRGNDLVLALNRSNYSLNLRRGS